MKVSSLMAREWNQQDVAAIREMLGRGMTYETIGMFFGVNRRAISGIVSRSGLTGISHNIGKPENPVKRRSLLNNYNFTAVPSRVNPVAPDLPKEKRSTAATWESFKPGVQCHWPLGKDDKGVFHFCGRCKPADDKIPYCNSHMKRARRSY